MSWETVKTAPNIVQVIPLEDEAEHYEGVIWGNLGFGDFPVSKCECHHRIETQENGTFIIIHSSFDGREGLEWAKDILNK